MNGLSVATIQNATSFIVYGNPSGDVKKVLDGFGAKDSSKLFTY